MDNKNIVHASAACIAGPSRARSTAARLLVAMAPLVLGACATVNTPINEQHALVAAPSAGNDYTFARWLAHRPGPIPELVIVSLSGGGARAAAFATGVLDELAKGDLDKKVGLISSTSGGSLTAAVFAAEGRDGIEKLSGNFLSRNHNFKLAKELAPSLLLPGGENRGVSFGNYLDANVFIRPPGEHPLTYEDLAKRWDEAPFVLLNATDMGSGRSFEFTQDNFYNLCSDLSKFPVSQAVAASAAFPFLLNPVPLQNHWRERGRECSAFVPGGRGLEKLRKAEERKYAEPEQLGRARYEYALRNTDNQLAQPKPDREIDYVHLLDGGLADNLGIRAITRQLHANYQTLKDKGVRKILLVQVNARSTMKSEYDKSSRLPSMKDVFLAVAEKPIDIATELSAYLSRLYLLNLLTSDAAVTALGDRISIYPVDVDFELLDERHNAARLAAEAIGTDWGLPDGAATVRFLKETASELVNENPCFKSFIAVPPGPGIQDPRDTCTFVQIVAQSSGVAPMQGAPTATPAAPAATPAPAPAPAPAATKVTYAADAFFDFDQSVLKSEGKAKLDDLVAKVQGIRLEVIIAVGHTDSIGSDSYNQHLSVLRAEAVKAYLVSKGIDRNHVYTEGKGEKQPVADNQSDGGRAKNRRVEIEVVGTRNQ